MKFDALVTSSGPAAVTATVGVPHEGSSRRSVFHTVSPVLSSSATMNESACVSHWRMTRPFQMIGELAGPHSKVGMSYAPMLTRPRSTFQRKVPFMSYAWTPCEPNHATTMRPSVAGVELA
jgi:hypothetical protein